MNMTYFEFYGIPVSFQVDEPALRRIFYQNSKKYHPDFHTLADEKQQAEMLELSSLNNEAYQTLSDPDRRMRYILGINGLLSDDGEDKQTMPRDFLTEMMDINESLMELEFDFDPERYAAALSAAETLENDLNDGIRPVLENYPNNPDPAADLRAVLEYYLKKRYLLRIRENLSTFAPRAGMAEW